MARASGLTQAQLLVLHTLRRKGQEMPRDISRALGVGQATISVQIDRLEARGFVRRERRQADRRAVWVILTDAGRDLLDQTPDPLHDRFTQRFEQLAPWEQAMLLAATERLSMLFDAENHHPAAISRHSARRRGACLLTRLLQVAHRVHTVLPVAHFKMQEARVARGHLGN